MIDERRGHLHALVLRHGTGLAELVHVHERHQRRPALVGDPRVDVVRVHLEVEPRHLLERRRSPRVDAGAQAAHPRLHEHVAVVEVVVGVMMRDEDVA